jgi:hypothetical protein
MPPTASQHYAAPAGPADRVAVNVLVLHTNDAVGEIDPCG